MVGAETSVKMKPHHHLTSYQATYRKLPAHQKTYDSVRQVVLGDNRPSLKSKHALLLALFHGALDNGGVPGLEKLTFSRSLCSDTPQFLNADVNICVKISEHSSGC